MKNSVETLVLSFLAVGLLCGGVPRCIGADKGKDAKKKDSKVVLESVEGEEEADPKDLENKLLKLTTMEEAFLKALRTINLLNRYIVQENSKLEQAKKEVEKKEIRKNIGAARKRLQTLSNAMDVIFGIGRRRTYEYNNVNSTVYLRVGTVEEAFARAVRTRDILRNAALKAEEEKKKEKDKAKKDGLQKRIDALTRQYQTVVASLQLIYGVTPQRNYQYDPKSSTLYLKISENEMDKLKTQLAELQKEREAEAKAKEKKAAPKKDTKKKGKK